LSEKVITVGAYEAKTRWSAYLIVILLGESRLMSQAGWWQRDACFQVGEKVQQSGGFPGAVALPW
jgi:hypothetical protein